MQASVAADKKKIYKLKMGMNRPSNLPHHYTMKKLHHVNGNICNNSKRTAMKNQQNLQYIMYTAMTSK